MRAITIAVDYEDLLSIVLSYNRHHFEEWWVVTVPGDPCLNLCADYDNVKVCRTTAFEIEKGLFRKWAALEEGLDAMGREGWIVVMDADVLWPSHLPSDWNPVQGYLYTPYRRILPYWPETPIPSEREWLNLDRHWQESEWAGYTQVFHADDPVLQNVRPWYDPSWIHCGGGDSFFQALWPRPKKIRPTWEVLHLGPHGANWFGRVSTKGDGTKPPEAAERARKLSEAFRIRRARGNFDHERR